MNFCGGQGIRQGLVLGRDFPDQAVDDCGGCLSVQTGCVVEQDTVLQHGMNNGLHILKGAESAPVAQSSGFGGSRQAQAAGAGPYLTPPEASDSPGCVALTSLPI